MAMGMASPEETVNTVDSDEEFYFESDHLALKGNKDYRVLLSTILSLQTQRSQALQDIETINIIQREALQDPIAFVEKLNNKEDLGIPPPIQLKELPEIDWLQYQHVMPKDINGPLTRTKHTQSSNASQNAEDSTSDDGNKIKIRGRAYDDSKPETFNQLWTQEEQKRLEELLMEFPPEEVEAKRWKKIAEALGNRTPQQVQSRVQKYFIKLHLAGLPVPGRIPRMNWDLLKKSHRHQRNNHFLVKPSTFFPSFDPPVLMNDNFEESSQRAISAGIHSTKGSILVSPSNMTEMLKAVIQEKEQADQSKAHTGYSCDGCGEDPVLGTRWHCEDCSALDIYYDLCSDCLASSALDDSEASSSKANISTVHNKTHSFIAFHFAKNTTCWDPDYLAPSTSYNYLDPNFMPG